MSLPIRDRLLLETAFGDDVVARAAWLRVARGLDLGLLPSETHAVLPLIAARLPLLGFRYVEQPLLDGVRKRTWYMNVARLNMVASAVETLSAAGLRPMASGGLAVLLAGGDMSLRRLADAEVAVAADPARRMSAVAALGAAGWVECGSRRDGALVDLHAQTWSRAGQCVTLRWSDAGWPHDGSGAARTALGGHTILRLPAPGDLLAYTVADCRTLPGYTALQLCADALSVLPRMTAVDWTRFLDRIGARRATPLAVAAVQALSTDLGADIPANVVGALADAAVPVAERWAARADPRSRLLAALLRRSSEHGLLPMLAGVAPFLCDAWQVERAAELPVIAMRRVRRRLRSAA